MENNDQSKSQQFSVKNISWLTITLALLAVGTCIAVSGPRGGYGVSMMGGGWAEDYGGVKTSPPIAPSIPQENGSVSSDAPRGMPVPDMYPYPYPEVPATDTREFLKVYYSVSLSTRNVPDLTRRVETIVRGHEGRIDQQSISERYGSVSFAVPQSKYEAFRSELESLVSSRFLSVNISSQNLLSQKISIEEQQKQVNKSLADYQESRQKLISDHSVVIQSLQSVINKDTQMLADLRAQTSAPQIESQITYVVAELTSLNRQVANENARYTTQLKYADANIKNAQDWQKAVQTQDKQLLDTVATVTGTISIRWMSLWEIAQVYLPNYWIPTIFAALALLSLFNDRRRMMSAKF